MRSQGTIAWMYLEEAEGVVVELGGGPVQDVAQRSLDNGAWSQDPLTQPQEAVSDLDGRGSEEEER